MCPSLNTWGLFCINQVQIVQCRRKVASGRNVMGVIRSLVNARGLQLKCAT